MTRAFTWVVLLLASLAAGCTGGGQPESPDEAATAFSEPQRDQFWVMVAFTDVLPTPDIREEPELIKVVIVGFALASEQAAGAPLLMVRLHSSDRAHFYLITKDAFDRFAAGQISAEAFLEEIRLLQSDAEVQQLKARLVTAT